MTPDPVTVLTDAVRVRELVAVLQACEGAEAVPVVFKGAALAHTHYGESWHRPRYDADLLIAAEHRERVFAILRRLGYERRTMISGDLVMYQAPFERVDHLGIEHALDIHWRLANPQLVAEALTHDELVARSVTVSVNGHRMRVPSPVDALLIACIHRVAHHPDFEHPVWIEDIHRLASRLDASEWTTFVDRAASKSIRAICLAGVMRAKDQFHTAVPTQVVQALNLRTPEPSAVFLLPLRPIDRLVADLRALKPLAAARLMREHLFPPADYMRQMYGVTSRALLPVYYAARVLGGVGKWFKVTRAA